MPGQLWGCYLSGCEEIWRWYSINRDILLLQVVAKLCLLFVWKVRCWATLLVVQVGGFWMMDGWVRCLIRFLVSFWSGKRFIAVRIEVGERSDKYVAIIYIFLKEPQYRQWCIGTFTACSSNTEWDSRSSSGPIYCQRQNAIQSEWGSKVFYHSQVD